MRKAAARLVTLALASVLAGACSNAAATGAVVATVASSSPAASSSAPTVAPTTPSPTPTASPVPTPNFNELPDAANNAAGVAQQLIAVDKALRDPNTPALELAWMAHMQQLDYSRLNDYPDWQPQVLAALPEQARAAAAGSLEASKQLHRIIGPVPKTLPDWQILDARPIDELMSYYKEAEATFGVPWYYLASIHLVESRMGRIHGLSTAGAQGPMQFMPATWAQYGKGDVNNDHDAILGAARYLVAAGAPGDMQRALYAYNHSDGYVNALIAYAQVMKNDPVEYRGYHGWQVYYTTVDGTVFLPVGWTKP